MCQDKNTRIPKTYSHISYQFSDGGRLLNEPCIEKAYTNISLCGTYHGRGFWLNTFSYVIFSVLNLTILFENLSLCKCFWKNSFQTHFSKLS